MREDQLQALVLEAAKSLGVLAYHPFDSRRSTPGFPDLVLVGGASIAYRELKSSIGRLTPEQCYWLDALRAVGSDAGIWRPADWPDQILSELRGLGPVAVPRPVLTQAQLRRTMQRRAKK